MGSVVRGRRTITLKQKLKAVRIIATGTQFQGDTPPAITLKAMPQQFEAVSYSWTRLRDNKVLSTAQQITVKNGEVDVVETYRVEVKDRLDDVYIDTLSITKVTDGKPGDVGKRGQVIVQREWKEGDIYRNNDNVIDYVYHRATDSWWRLRDGYDNIKAGLNPSNQFVQLTSLEHLAVNNFVAENANIAGFIFKDKVLKSQLPNLTNPNLILDGVNGKIIANDAQIKGHIEGTSGSIKNMTGENITVTNLNATNGSIKNITGDNITINSGTFKGKVIFEDGTSAQDAIDLKVKEGVDSIQVGGRNLYINSAVVDLSNNNNDTNPALINVDPTNNIRYVMKRSTDKGNSISLYNYVLLNSNRITEEITSTTYKDYMCSMMVKCEVDMTVCLNYPDAPQYWKYAKFCKAGVWTQISAPLNDSVRLNGFGVLPSDVVRDKKIWYKDYKLERSNKPSNWSPAPEDLDTKIGNIQVGGTNLLKNTTKEIKYLQFTGWNHYPNGYEDYIEAEPLTEYTFRYYIRSTDFDATARIFQFDKDKKLLLESDNGTIILTAGAAGYVYVTIKTLPNAKYIIPVIRAVKDRGTGKNGLNFSELKLEKGNKYSDWSPSPEDVNNKIDSIQSGSRNYIRTAQKNLQIRDTRYSVVLFTEPLNGVYTIAATRKVVSKGAKGNPTYSLLNFMLKGTTTSINHSPVPILLGEGETKFTIDTKGQIIDKVYIYSGTDWAGSETIHTDITDLRIVKGNIAADWTESLEDINARIKDQELYTEYSVNGTTAWHTPATSADRFMRQKKGDGAWSVALPFGKDGVNGKDGNNGVPGKDGKYTISNFAKNTSLTVAPTTGWTALPPALAVSEYLWQRQGEVTPPATQPATWQTAFRISGPAGSNGSDGKNGTNGINGKDGRYTLLQYAKNTSTTVAPTTGFTEAPPVLATNEFLWMRKGDVIPPSTTPASWTAPTRISGLHGQDGKKGDQGIQGVQGPVGEPLGDGVMLFTDPDFQNDRNGMANYVSAYPNRVARTADNPTKSSYMMRITNTGQSVSSTDLRRGGFVHVTQSRANAVFIHKIIAKIPVGHTINDNRNLIGNGGTSKWLTPMVGTGKYETYIFKIICGTDGTFSTLGYISFNGPAGTAAAPINYDIAYSTIFDMSIPDRSLDFLKTTVVGNSIATGTLLVGQNGNATAGITGFRASGETSNVAFWAGLSYDNRNTAPFRVYTDGRLFATQATISGTINATAGTFNNVTANNLTVNSGKFTGTVNANAGTFNNVTANNLTVNSGTFKGRIEAESGYFGGFLVNNQGMINDITKNDHKLEFGYQVAWTGIKSALGMNYKFMYSEGTNALVHNCNSQIVNTSTTGTDHNVALLLTAARSAGGRNHALVIEKGDIAGMALYTKHFGVTDNIQIYRESVVIYTPINGSWICHVSLPTGEYRYDGRTVTIMCAGNGKTKIIGRDAVIYSHEGHHSVGKVDNYIDFFNNSSKVTMTYSAEKNWWFVTHINIH